MHGTLQVVYPATSCEALSPNISRSEREAYDSAMRQAMSLARWAHMFDAAKHMQRAANFLGARMRLMITVRPRVLSISTCNDSVWAAVATHWYALLQGDLKFHERTGYDIIFECWAVADRLSLHALAADCEWALTRLWQIPSVYMRAGLDLSPGALQRIARSLCDHIQTTRRELDNIHSFNKKGIKIDSYLERASNCPSLSAIASAKTMMEWRMSKEG